MPAVANGINVGPLD